VGDYTAFLEEKINRFKLIKGARTEKQEENTFADLVERNYQFNLRLIKLKFFLNPSNDFLGMIAVAVIYLLYSFRLARGEANLGDIVFYLYLVRTAYKPVKKVAQAWGQLHVALVSTRKIFRMLDEPEEVLSTPEKTGLLKKVESLSLEHVTFAYPDNGTDVIKGISMEAMKGDIIAMEGKSGAGKSTLMNLIPRFYTPDQGTIRINGTDYTRFSLDELRSKVAHVDSETLFMNGTIRHNIQYGNGEMKTLEQEEFAKFLGLDHTGDLDLVIGKDGIDLSEGQKQKIAFLRAIHAKPEVLILDETFSSLDREDIDYIMKSCRSVAITFLVSRKKEVTLHATRTITIKNGRIQD
jgi:subfamily B ATP-binding cassette protein MsbA